MKKTKKIILIVLAALVLLVGGALAFAGNYLFHFALDPQAGGMLSAYDPEGVTLEGDAAWFDGNSQDRWLESRDGLRLPALGGQPQIRRHLPWLWQHPPVWGQVRRPLL